jgi:hypothetical protein
LRQLAVALITDGGKLIEYVAFLPAVTVTTVLGTLGAVDEPEGESISNCNTSEVPPPGPGVCTVIAVAPGVAMSAAVTVAVSCVELTNCVVSADVLQYTAEAVTNPDPFTVMVNAAPPALATAGVMLPRNGTGLGRTFTVRFTLSVAVV